MGYRSFIIAVVFNGWTFIRLKKKIKIKKPEEEIPLSSDVVYRVSRTPAQQQTKQKYCSISF